MKLLDIQRSGQIPEAINSAMFSSNGFEGKYASPELIKLMSWLPTRFPGKVGAYVDWYKVEALGSVQKYPDEKAKQNKLHGMSPEATALQKQQAEKEKQNQLAQEEAAEAQALKDAMDKEEYDKSYFEFMPGQHVPKFQPDRELETA